ncbi:MAG: YitT family protein [Oscillospiraceae bacterium]|nr:YitT family protein [Oscillospiraceae bacterium]
MRSHSFWKSLPSVLLGNVLYAFAIAAFVIPGGLITGGTTGLALFFHHSLGVPVDLFVTCSNVLMFLLGVVFLGKSFALTTLVSTFAYPLLLSLFQRLPFLQQLTSDRLLCALYAGALIGLGLGLVLRVGASTGGLDIPPLLLQKKWGISLSLSMYLLDFTILLLQMFLSESEEVLYGILLVLIYTLVMDKVLVAGKRQIQVQIVSEKFEEINAAIQNGLDRGSTLMQAVSGRLREERLVVFSVISHRELPRLKQLVAEIDPAAFLVVAEVGEVRGRGFSMEKISRPDSDEGPCPR